MNNKTVNNLKSIFYVKGPIPVDASDDTYMYHDAGCNMRGNISKTCFQC